VLDALWRVFTRKKVLIFSYTTHIVATLFCHYILHVSKTCEVPDPLTARVSLQKTIAKI